MGHKQDDICRAGGHLHALLLNGRGQCGFGARHTVLDFHCGHVKVGAYIKRDREVVAAVASRRGTHVHHAFHAVYLLLYGCSDNRSHSLCVGSGIGSRHIYRWRSDVGELRYRKRLDRKQTCENHNYGEHHRKDGAAYKEA